jgi:hypothetical protein
MTTGSAYHLRWPLVAPIPSATTDSFSISRRTLYRALAVVVALAAISPLLFEADLGGNATGDPQPAQVQLAGLPPLLQTSRTAVLVAELPAPPRFQHH